MYIYVSMYIHVYIYVYMCVYTCIYMCMCMLSCFSCVQLFETPWTVGRQASLSMRFSR